PANPQATLPLSPGARSTAGFPHTSPAIGTPPAPLAASRFRSVSPCSQFRALPAPPHRDTKDSAEAPRNAPVYSLSPSTPRPAPQGPSPTAAVPDQAMPSGTTREAYVSCL